MVELGRSSVIPNFFLVGAPKCGTTSLMRYLAQHPDVAVSRVKEPCYFAPEVPDGPDITREWPDYIALFDEAGTARAVGEGSVSYLASLTAAASIHAGIPDARILMILRDPAERWFAHYVAARAAGATRRPFIEWAATPPAQAAARPGFYADHLARYRAHFAKDRILVLWFDDFTRDPSDVVRRAFAFLGVDPNVPVDVSVRHNATTMPRWPMPRPLRHPLSRLARNVLPSGTADALRSAARTPATLAPTVRERSHGIALYRNDIWRLCDLTGRDLSAWLRIER